MLDTNTNKGDQPRLTDAMGRPTAGLTNRLTAIIVYLIAYSCLRNVKNTKWSGDGNGGTLALLYPSFLTLDIGPQKNVDP